MERHSGERGDVVRRAARVETQIASMEPRSGERGDGVVLHLCAHALLAGACGLPYFVAKQVDDLRCGYEGVAGGNTGPGLLGKNRGGDAAEIVEGQCAESAGDGSPFQSWS